MPVELVDLLLPAIGVLGVLLRSRRGRSNLWDVLHELARGRASAAAERERRETLVEMLDRLPAGGGRVEDYDARGGGRTTVIGAPLPPADGPRP
ncbi:hypothetical protein [Streptomyces chrestomyceticus]|uniref:hypothetical protein n=1 Tax=Streptomyces chrestomyceticus TaxID=68185 RepID=UPI0019D0A853|nr:hypothetical protein [Streptomyces chrestomyceticus]